MTAAMPRVRVRGVFNGLCGTPGCPNNARWIPIAEGNKGSQVYRCVECCNSIDERARDDQARDLVDSLRNMVGGLPLNDLGEPTTDFMVPTWRDFPESIVHHCLWRRQDGCYYHSRLGIHIIVLDELPKP